MRIPAALRDEVRQRAGDRCEYCQLPQACTVLPHEPDHIRSQKHRGLTTFENLCWACAQCNNFKGSDVSCYDPATNDLVPVFDPRINSWNENFEWQGPVLCGKTKIGRATIELLRINLQERTEHRRMLMEVGLFSPQAGTVSRQSPESHNAQ